MIVNLGMSALGQKQPLNNSEILTSEWLVLGYTGHSPLDTTSGCFRPIPDIRTSIDYSWQSQEETLNVGYNQDQ
jgi:hypothetical protein